MKLINNSILMITALFFIGCGDNTDTPLTHLVTSIEINETNLSIHSTDDITRLGAIVNFDDGTTSDVTNNVDWYNSDYNATSMLSGEVSGGVVNGGESTISIQYGDFQDSINVKAQKLLSFYIDSKNDENTTGEHIFEAKGSFENGDTNITIEKNIIWNANNDAVITIEDYIVTIDIKAGDTNVTAQVFDQNETNISNPIALKTIKFKI